MRLLDDEGLIVILVLARVPIEAWNTLYHGLGDPHGLVDRPIPKKCAHENCEVTRRSVKVERGPQLRADVRVVQRRDVVRMVVAPVPCSSVEAYPAI